MIVFEDLLFQPMYLVEFLRLGWFFCLICSKCNKLKLYLVKSYLIYSKDGFVQHNNIG
jgi:hypothetical protein